MSPYARLVYIALKSRYGFKIRNNGRIYLSTRDGAEETGFDMKTVARALRELKHYGFIVMTEPGCLGINGRGKAPHWRLTELGYMTEPPTRDFLKWDGTLFHEQKNPKHYLRKKQNPVPSDGTECTTGRNIRAFRPMEQSPEKLCRPTEHTDEEARTVQRHISRVNHSPPPEWSPASLQPDLTSLVVTEASLNSLWRKVLADG
jgi:hypothetical protein